MTGVIDADGLTRAALIGVATGGRTTAGLAALSLATPARPGLRAAALLGAAGEFVADKLPNTPSRLSARGLPGRIIAAAACGVLLARHPPESDQLHEASEPLPDADPRLRIGIYAGTAALASVAGSWIGHRWRGWAGGSDARGLRSYLAATLEDTAVAALAGAAARPRSPGMPATRG